MKTLGIYIHIPFCARKCYYCDFVSFPGMEHSFERYIDCLLSEARLYNEYLKNRVIDTLYIGGGTPSLLPPGQIARLISGLADICQFSLKEATIEANPETVDKEKLEVYASCGINRLSLGLQTHEDGILKAVGRRHTFKTFLDAYDSAKEYFSNINIDTIFGLPGQSVKSFETTMRHITGLNPGHVSAYSLKLEPGTALYEAFSGADDETDREMYHTAVKMLESAGCSHYETSNFAKEGMECLHNLKYWTGGEYLGLGVAAHSYIFDGMKYRRGNTDNLDEYFGSVNRGMIPAKQKEIIGEKDEKEEYIMLRLRLKRGIDFSDYEARFKSSFIKEFAEPVSLAENAGLIRKYRNKVIPTLKGFDMQNTLISEFIKIL